MSDTIKKNTSSVASSPVMPAPVMPAPVMPAPVMPAPVMPAPVKPAPVKPAPVTLFDKFDLMMEGADKRQKAIKSLAGFDSCSYDNLRKEAAKELDIRVGTLDEEVKKARNEFSSNDQPSMFPEDTMWEEEVCGHELLDDIEQLIGRFIVCSKETMVAIALWIVLTWFVKVIDICPIAAITAPEKRCAKTILLSFIGKLSYRSMIASNISPAALFRAIDEWSLTLLIDEADSFMKDNEDLRGIINSGHSRDSAFVIRVVGDDHTPTPFFTFGAKAIAGIGKLPDTIMDRSVVINLRRKLPHEKVERLRHADQHIFTQLRMKLARFYEDYGDEIKISIPELPESLNDRAQDNWEPLLAIADAAGGEWPQKAREAALVLSGGDEATTTVGTDLLVDIQDIFKSQNIDRIASRGLILALCNDPQKRWGTYNRGKPITPRQVSTRLSEYGIKSRDLRFENGVFKGYLWSDFEDVCKRYLPTKTSEDLDNISFL